MKDIEDFVLWTLRDGPVFIEDVIEKIKIWGFTKEEIEDGIRNVLLRNLAILKGSGILSKK